MKKINSVLIAGLLLMVYTSVFTQGEALTGGTADPGHGLIKGKVTDTKAPTPKILSDATVTVANDRLLSSGARITLTGLAGNYEVPNLPPGEYIVIVHKPGYRDSRDYVTVTPGGVAFYDVRLYRTDTLVTYFWKMGAVRWPLLFCSLLLLCSIPVTVVYITRRIGRLGRLRSEINEVFVSRVREVLQNNDMLGAISTCYEVGGVADILKAGLLQYAELSRKDEVAGKHMQKVIWTERVRGAMEKAGVAVKEELESRWSLVVIMFGVIALMAMLYGFLGTVMAVNMAYRDLALRGTGDPTMLAAGISNAWLAAPFGLVIATISANLCLIAFIIHRILNRKASTLISGAQRTFAGIIDSLFTSAG